MTALIRETVREHLGLPAPPGLLEHEIPRSGAPIDVLPAALRSRRTLGQYLHDLAQMAPACSVNDDVLAAPDLPQG